MVYKEEEAIEDNFSITCKFHNTEYGFIWALFGVHGPIEDERDRKSVV